jgi:DNA-binding NarL/FixJ family response regulator
LGWRYHPQASIVLVFDVPLGFAWHALTHAQENHQHVVVVPIPASCEYYADLWDAAPNAVVMGSPLEPKILQALTHLTYGERYRDIPYSSPLTPAERTVLRYVAQDWRDRQIADHLNQAPQTVTNRVADIRTKVGIQRRAELALYYWGIWRPPKNDPQCQ